MWTMSNLEAAIFTALVLTMAGTITLLSAGA
jgi:hypothetical protein